LTEGIKELTLHRARRKEFIDQELHGAADLYRRTSIDAARQYAIAEAWSHFAFYSMIGVILFVFPLMFPLSTESLIGYVVVLLYMMSPIWGIIGILPTVERGQVAFENIQRLGVSLDNSTESRHSVVPPVTAGQLESLTLESVTFQYATDSRGNDPFSLGPISLSLCPGELSFVIGGNGSGKSTFVKLLAGLYVPHSGEVSLNGTLISDANRDWYREHFSVVFSDFYLFEKLLGIEEERIRTSAAAYLSSLQLDHKVEVRERKFSTVDLSQGQRKRLALLTAYLEDRPVYVFDEWAADQDPQYKDVFYMKLLPELRARGKSVVVITHDDRYFHLGDRVIKLENGKVVSS
jgi:putative ATP-binding cassette transporter